ncbi:conjugative transfer ATPase [Legionella anisa]|uniref:Conjugative transfer ATPase n=1 Tax=Legionella anisa TaxID=28082 RepID=A0AAX0WWJ4_9GAMM|nr:conjugative transfer ATPase [Legionella anisa]MDW9132310.1 conjugative transfer ATPase [Legionella pneumophila]AWN73411.1 conjugative transfer ATPase [Legionella anisa]KTC66966.1 Type IV secretory protein VirB4 component [Legionella anisa]MBN5934194.1 conjugative transfer ATPase [Legionella anisa]MCW8426279.1 conjugative transfer ATPase [Legionella anisa]
MKSLLKPVSDWLLGETNPQAVKEKEVKKSYTNPLPSFADKLAVVDFNEQEQVFLFADGNSLGSGFELGDIPAEAAAPEYLQAVFDKIRETFASVVPLHPIDPWVMQMFVQDEYCLEFVLDHIKKQVPENLLNNSLTKDYLNRLGDLYKKMTRPEGLFLDPKTGSPYRGRRRRIRVLFYRKLTQYNLSRELILQEHQEVISQIESKLRSPGIELKRLSGKDYYQWWVRWFNPKSADQILTQYPYPEPIPAGFNLSQNVLFTPPESSDQGFIFEGVKQKILYVDGLKETPIIGLVSRERRQANPKHRYALLDTLPSGSIYTIQVVFSHDATLDAHLTRLEKGIVGTSLKPQEVRDDIKSARNELSTGNRLYWVNQAVFYQAKNEQDAHNIEKQLHIIFSEAKMPLIHSNYDIHPLNSYLNMLPFNFDPHYARKYLCFDRLMYASELAALLPVYGRNQGARHLPCFSFFNRLGEPVFFDLLHHDFISQNSHCAIFANSGGGKSVLIGWMIQSLLAMKNARVVLFEMGNSFDRMLMHCQKHGLQARQLLLSNQKDKAIPLNPFCDAYKALPEISEQSENIALTLQKLKAEQCFPASEEELDCQNESRSYLAELALALRTMITEANVREEENFTLADETLLIEILSDAIYDSAQKNIPQMLTEHVLSAFERRIASETIPRKKERLHDMADRLRSYVINTAKARFFNVATEPLDDFDIFHIDISAIKDDRGKLALVMVSLLPRILAMAERTQNEIRPMFLIIDEAHLQFEIDVIVSYATLIAKVARKLGLWLIPLTQNIADMSSAKATKILSLIETWIALGLDENELTNIKKFKTLTPQQEALIRDIDSQKGLYSEAVLLGSRYQGLFRVIPPRYLLALLMTEKNEKAARNELEKEHDVLAAAEIMAKKLEQPKVASNNRAYFYD